MAPRQVRFENGEAWLGDFDGRRPSLLLEKPGHQAVLFDWTARGETTPMRSGRAAVEAAAEQTLTLEPKQSGG